MRGFVDQNKIIAAVDYFSGQVVDAATDRLRIIGLVFIDRKGDIEATCEACGLTRERLGEQLSRLIEAHERHLAVMARRSKRQAQIEMFGGS